MLIPYDCLIEIFAYLKLNKLKKLMYLTKNFSSVIYQVIQSFSNKKKLQSLRYCISIDNLSLFIEMQQYALSCNFFYLLRYACRLKNETFVDHLLTLNISPHLISRCIMDMIKLYNKQKNKMLLSIIYKVYFFLLMSNVKEASVIPSDFFNQFYKKEYIDLYDELNHRWMIFKME